MANTATLHRYDAIDEAARIESGRLLDAFPRIAAAPARPIIRPGLLGPAERDSGTLRAKVQSSSLLAADVFAVIAAIVVVSMVSKLPLTAVGSLAAVVVSLVFTRLAGLNDKDGLVLRRSTLDEAPRLLERAALVSCAYWLTLPEGPGRAPLLLLLLGVWTASVGMRLTSRTLSRFVLPAERCLFIGDMAAAGDIRAKLDGGRSNARLVGALALRGDDGAEAFGGIEGLRAIVRAERVSRVIIAPISVSASDTLDLIRVAKEAGVQVSIFPRLFEVVGTAVEFEDLEGITLMGVRRFGLSLLARTLKRSFDLVGAAVATFCVAPLLIAVAIAVKLDTSGPVFFRQVRVGRDGRRFHILKFRSMVTDAESMKDRLRDHNETDGLFKIADDPRVTRVGRILRKTSLDELPQLINVLRGEMSLVGPRPLVVDEDKQVLGLDRRRLHLTPGMTGPWQVMRSGRVPMHEMVAIDYLYVSTWSLWNDFKLLLRTASYVLSRGGM